MTGRRLPGALVAALLALAPGPASAQYVPYYGKNRVAWDHFEWRVYRSPHFDVHYYPEAEPRLERLVALAEGAYRELAEDLGHEIRSRIPLITYGTHSEFEQTNVLGQPVDESVGAFAEPGLNRMVLPIDGSDDEVRRLVKHELAHIFQFSMVYGGLVTQLLVRRPPDWAMEGFADYVSRDRNPLKRMLLRDLVLTGRIPRLSRVRAEELPNPVLIYSLGHAAFLAIEERWGKEGVRRLWWGFRKSTLGRSASPWETALGIDDEELDRTFELWLRRSFPLDEGRERPWVYDRRLELEGDLEQVLGLAPSPSGEVLAVLAVNRHTGELDLALVSAADGRVLRNLTPGTTEKWDWLNPDGQLAEGRSIAWDARGERVAAFARSGKRRNLLVFDAASGELLHRHRLRVEGASGPSFSPDGRELAFAATGGLDRGLYRIELATGAVTALGPDTANERTPALAPEGGSLVAVRREAGFDRLVRRSLAPGGAAAILRRGEWNDTAPWFDRQGNLWFVSDRLGSHNVWRIARGAAVAEQMTDVIGGNFCPVVLEGPKPRLAFISYYERRFDAFLTTMPEPRRSEPLEGAAAADALAATGWPALDPGAMRERSRRGLHLTRLSETQLGVSSDGTFFGQTAVVFEDLFGDRELWLAARSVRSFRSIYAAWVARGRRLEWGAEGYDLRDYFLTDPALADTDDAEVATRLTGGGLRARYPFSRRLRSEAELVYEYREREFRDLELDLPLLRDGSTVRASAALVEETTRFRWFGPLSGRTWKIEGRFAPSTGSLLGYQSVRGDARGYLQLGRSSLAAFRAAGFWSGGSDPEVFAFGGGSEFRGAEYRSIAGTRGFLGNIELRLPLIDLMATPLVTLGGIRATLFADVAGAWNEGQDFQFSSSEGGFHLEDAIATFGAGMTMPFVGMPLHFDWSWPTDLERVGDARFSVWLGYEY